MEVIACTGTDYRASPVDALERVLVFPEDGRKRVMQLYLDFLWTARGDGWRSRRDPHDFYCVSDYIYDILPPDAEAGIRPDYVCALLFPVYSFGFLRVPEAMRSVVRNEHLDRFEGYLLERGVLFSERVPIGFTADEQLALSRLAESFEKNG